MALNLPEAVNTTYVPNVEIKSEDLTDIQAQMVILAKGWRKMPLSGVGDVVNFGTEGIFFQAGAATRAIEITTRVTERIKTLVISYSRDAGDSMTVELRRKIQGAPSARVSPAAGSLILAAGVESQATIDVTADFAGGLETANDARYYLYFLKAGASTNTGIEMLEYEYDTPRT